MIYPGTAPHRREQIARFAVLLRTTGTTRRRVIRFATEASHGGDSLALASLHLATEANLAARRLIAAVAPLGNLPERIRFGIASRKCGDLTPRERSCTVIQETDRGGFLGRREMRALEETMPVNSGDEEQQGDKPSRPTGTLEFPHPGVVFIVRGDC
jgi:hypothetical protein